VPVQITWFISVRLLEVRIDIACASVDVEADNWLLMIDQPSENPPVRRVLPGAARLKGLMAVKFRN
jgi:hypothetical protein